MAFVGVAAVEDGAFDLDTDEVSAVGEGEIEGGGVSPGLSDDEAEFGGTGRETQLCPRVWPTTLRFPQSISQTM